MNDQITGTPPTSDGVGPAQAEIDAARDAEIAQLREDVDAANERAEQAATAAAEAEGKTPVFVVYDKTYERYLSGTHKTKDAATKAAKDRKVKSYRVDEVYR